MSTVAENMPGNIQVRVYVAEREICEVLDRSKLPYAYAYSLLGNLQYRIMEATK